MPVLYSWPSNGSVILYSHDSSNAEVSGAHFMNFLKDVVAVSGADTVAVIAHSMGTRTLTVALNEIGARMSSTDRPLIKEIILAAPDVDRDQFLNVAEAVGRTGLRITLYASKNDRALQVSKAINGFPRLGDATDGVTVFKGGDSIDASVAGDDVLAHSYHGETNVLLDLHNVILNGSPPEKRFGLLSQGSPPSKYWVMRPGLEIARPQASVRFIARSVAGVRTTPILADCLAQRRIPLEIGIGLYIIQRGKEAPRWSRSKTTSTWPPWPTSSRRRRSR